MKNSNLLVSLAYMKTNDNPFIVFCSYILFSLLQARNQSLRADELHAKLLDVFELDMPQTLINTCIRMLKSSGEVEVLPNGAGYAIKSTQFDVAAFEKNMVRLRVQEEKVLSSITSFVEEQYNMKWSIGDAKQYLSFFLNEEGYGSRLFLQEDLDIDSKYVTPSFCLGRYVDYIQSQEDSLEKLYLEEIVNGMMIYHGIYQTNDFQQEKAQKFKNTVFYLDTKIFLRALGYSWTAQVKATRELISLIREKYEGRIGIFRETLTEIQNALDVAGRAYDKNKRATDIKDPELCLFAQLNPEGASLMTEASTSVFDRLQSEFGVGDPPRFDWDSPEVQRHTIESQKISEYIANERNWREGAIKFDVQIINQINILRKSNYSKRYGGREKLPVFVTSNSSLVYTFREYISSIEDENCFWNVHALPVISDSMILYRLWVPYATEYSTLPSITLARFAYVAQNESSPFFEKLRELALSYKDQKGIYSIDVSEVRRRQIEDIIIKLSKGDSDNLTDEIVASGFEELIEMEKVSLQDKVDHLTAENESNKKQIANRDSLIVSLAAAPFLNKIGWRRVIIWAAMGWWIIATAIILVLVAAVEQFINSDLKFAYLAGFLPLFIEIILTVIDKIVDDKNLRHCLIKPAVNYVWRKYVQKITVKIGEVGQPYKGDIINYCLYHSKLFATYREYCIYR